MSSKHVSNIYKKFRKGVVSVLILGELILSAFIYLESTAYFGMYDIFEIIITFALIFYIFMISNDLEEYEENEVREEFISQIGPYSLIYINRSGDIERLKGDLESLSLSSHLTLSSLKELFSRKEWEKLENIASKSAISKQKTSGLISFVDNNNQIRHLRYVAQLVKSDALDGLLIWFFDDSEVKAESLNLIQLFHKYRLMSYELDMVMNTLPIPIWKRGSGGKIIYYNKAYRDLLQKMGYVNFQNNINELESDLYEQMIEGRLSEITTKKVLILDEHPVILRIHENLALDNSSVGYCLFINETDSLNKKVSSLNNIIDNILKINNNAILIINNLGNVEFYNQLFIHMFELDQNIISQDLSFSSLIDHMKEKGKLPEVKDYKEFKLQQMQYITNYVESKYFLMHLTDGKTLRVTVTAVQGGETIFSYEDISGQLNLERAYQQQNNLVKNLIALYDYPIVIFGLNGRLEAYNNKFEKVFNLTEQPIKHIHFLEIYEMQEECFKNTKEYRNYKMKLASAIDFRSNISFGVELNNKDKFKVEVSPLSEDCMIVRYFPN